jgi:hypothetical protein
MSSQNLEAQCGSALIVLIWNEKYRTRLCTEEGRKNFREGCMTKTGNYALVLAAALGRAHPFSLQPPAARA